MCLFFKYPGSVFSFFTIFLNRRLKDTFTWYSDNSRSFKSIKILNTCAAWLASSALAEFAATLEAIVLYAWLNQRLPQQMQVSGAIIKGLSAAVVSAIATYAIALYLPGGAVVTALIGMSVGGMIALTLVWSEAKQLINL